MADHRIATICRISPDRAPIRTPLVEVAATEEYTGRPCRIFRSAGQAMRWFVVGTNHVGVIDLSDALSMAAALVIEADAIGGRP